MTEPVIDCPSEIVLTLPDPLRRFLAERVRESGYADPGAYIYHVLRDEQKRLVRQRVIRLLHEGASAPMQERAAGQWAALRAAVGGAGSGTVADR